MKSIFLNILVLPILLFIIPPTYANSLYLVGESHFKLLWLPIYHSRLYTNSGQYQTGERPVKLEIQYLMNVQAKQLIARTASEWEQLGIDKKNQHIWLQALKDLWPNIQKNDVLTLYVDQHNTSTFYWNGKSLGHIADTDFGQNFLDIWLSPNTSEPKHREELLGIAKQ